MVVDAILKSYWSDTFTSLMSQCFYFLTYKFNVFGYHISFFNCMLLVETFHIVMNFIGGVFGSEEVQNGGE